MNEKNLRLPTAIMTGIMLILGIFEKIFHEVSLFETVGSVVNPLLFIATLVCAYFAFKNDVSYESKWLWAVIAIHFSFTLGNIANLPVSAIVYKTEFIYILMSALCTVGMVLVFAAVFNKNLVSFLPIGFAVSALYELISIFVYSSFITFVDVAAIVVYVLFALLTLNKLPALNGLFRTLIVILSVICVPNFGFFYALSLIILAFIIVPAGRGRLTFAEFAAILCIATAIVGVIVYFVEEPAYKIGYINRDIESTKMEIKENEDYKDKIAELEEEKAEYEQNLKAAKDKLEAAKLDLDKAETELEKVCYRSSYSYYLCDYNCRSLHSNVQNCENQVSTYESRIEIYETNIERAETSIEYYKENMASLKKELLNLRIDLVGEIFKVIVNFAALALSVAGLILLAVCLFKSEYGRRALLSCALLAAGSLISILTYTRGYPYWSFDILDYPFVRFVLNPYFASIVIAAVFAILFTKNEGKRVIYRIIAIIAAAVMISLSATAGIGAVAFILFAITAICVSFVLVPAVFTEYNGIAKHIFFSIITLGIWQLIWIYNVTKNLNKVSSVNTRKPVVELLLYLFLPLYYVYWILKTAEATEAYGAENGKNFKIDILCLVFAFVCPVISTVLIQDKINLIVGKPE